jgi:3-dehydroquinate synthase
VLERVYTEAIQESMDRKSPIVAVGGGVIGDLAGFAAATYLRGVPFFQVPTSLLAQVDSSVGGKVAINHPLGKNLIGAFYQPAGVLIDPAVLTTLPQREYLSGLAEVLKYGFIADSLFLNDLREKQELVLSRDSGVLESIIAKCCEIKASFVEKDEKETGIRIFLNFGHTAGHAWEVSGNFEQFLHGEAVSLGMVCAARIGMAVGLTDEADVKIVEDTLRDFGLPISIDNIDSGRMVEFMATDKKRENGNIRWVLLRKIGIATTYTEIPLPLVKEILEGMTIS